MWDASRCTYTLGKSVEAHRQKRCRIEAPCLALEKHEHLDLVCLHDLTLDSRYPCL